MNLSTLGRFALVLSVPAFLLACVADSTSPPVAFSAGGGPVPEAEDAGAAEDGGPSAHPILALVDTGQTMTVAPGQGVGVFAEYDSGGLWHVWWTCGPQEGGGDPPCQFDVTVSVASGTIASPQTQGFLATDTFKSSPTTLEGITTTTTAFDGFSFQTAPGAVITLGATVGGVYDGRFLFFVEGGKIQDGAPWLVTDPVLLQGSNP
jgi:hypothetical protein